MLKLLWVDFRHSALAMAAIAVLIAAAIALTPFIALTEQALKEGGAKAAERFDLIVGGAQGETQLTLSVVFLDRAVLPLMSGEIYEAIAKNPLAERAAPVAFGDYYDDMPVIGTTTDMFASGRVSLGRAFENEREAVAGAKTGLKIGDRFTPIHGSIGQSDAHIHEGVFYHVVGIASFGDAWDRAIMVSIESIWNAHGMGRSFGSYPAVFGRGGVPPVSAVVVKPKTIAGAYELRSAYKRGETQAVFAAETLAKLYGMLGDISEALGKIAFAAQIFAAVVAAAAAMIYIRLKRRQIAVLRAFGADARRIFLVIFAQMTILGAFAAALGVAIGYAAATLASSAIAASRGFEAVARLADLDSAAVLTPLAILQIALAIACAFSFRYSAAHYLKHNF